MASISNSALLESIASLEKELNRLKAHLGEGGAVPVKEKKKRAVNPDAKPNPWIEFLKRVQPIVKESDIKGPATIGVLFAKSLKATQENAYEMEDEAILAALKEWATPENIEHAKSLKKEKKAKEESASESGSVADSEAAEKPKRVLSEEQKAKMKAGREAAKAKKDAEKAAAAEGTEKAAEPKEAPKEAPKKAFAKKEKKVEYSIAQLQDWNTLTFEEEEFGVNVRGDVINGDGDYAGHWDGKTLNRDATKPADWDTFN